MTPATAPPRDSDASVRFLSKYIIPPLVPLLMPFMKILSAPSMQHVSTKVLINESRQKGLCYDEGGHPMQGSALEPANAKKHCGRGFETFR